MTSCKGFTFFSRCLMRVLPHTFLIFQICRGFVLGGYVPSFEDLILPAHLPCNLKQKRLSHPKTNLKQKRLSHPKTKFTMARGYYKHEGLLSVYILFQCESLIFTKLIKKKKLSSSQKLNTRPAHFASSS